MKEGENMANGGNVTFHFLGDTSNLDKIKKKPKIRTKFNKKIFLYI